MGSHVAAGTATLGAEICEQVQSLDAVIVPIGGGGLCAGVSSAVKALRPDCQVIGVEPSGADSMRRSIGAGHPVKLDRVDTIADSLGAPFALPYSFELCQRNLDDLVVVDDDMLRESMRWLFHDMKMAVEPACAATTAALAGPLRGRFSGKRVMLIFCGSNIDWATFATLTGMSEC